jgi:hypothetical protein
VSTKRTVCAHSEVRSHPRSVSRHRSLNLFIETIDDILAVARVKSTDSSHSGNIMRRKSPRNASYRYGRRQFVCSDQGNHGAILASDE